MNRLVVSLALLAFPLSAFADDVVPFDLGGGQFLASVGVPAGVDSVCLDAPGLPSQCGAPIVADCGNPLIPAGCGYVFQGVNYLAPSNTDRVFAAVFPLTPSQRVTARFSCPNCRETTSLVGILRDAVKPLAALGAPFTSAPYVPQVPPADPMLIRPAVDGLPTCTPPADPNEIVPLKLASGQYLAIARFPEEADSICFKSTFDLPCTNSAGRTPVVGGKVTVDGVAYNDNGQPIAFASAFVRKLSLPAASVVRAEAYKGALKTLSAKFYRVPTTGGTPPTDPNTPPPMTGKPPAGSFVRQANGDVIVDSGPKLGSLTFANVVRLENQTITGQSSVKPDNRGAAGCSVVNALWDHNDIGAVPEGADLSNPSSLGKVGSWWLRNSRLHDTTHVGSGHEDLVQVFRGPGQQGGWLVFQDSTFDNAGTNGFIWEAPAKGPTAYANGACADPIGMGGVVWQGLKLGPPKAGGNMQILLFGDESLQQVVPELWIVDVDYRGGVGFDLRNGIRKVIVVGGSTEAGGTDGWPGPLKPFRPHTTITEATCPAGGWKGGKCCPNGRVNPGTPATRANFVHINDSPIDPRHEADTVEFYCYDDLPKAIAAHGEPPLARFSDAGWATTTPPMSGAINCPSIRAAVPGVAYCQDYEGITSLATWPFNSPFDNCLNTPENPMNGCVGNIIAGGFRGSRSLAQQFQPGREGGTIGVKKFTDTPLRTVGIAQARMWTGNFVPRDHGVKDNRFGGETGNFEVFGESATGPGSCKGTITSGNRFPFGAIPDITVESCQVPPLSSSKPTNCVQSAAVGRICEDDVHYDFLPGNGYDFTQDMKPGQWVCLRAQFDNFGLANMRARYWVGDKLVIDGVVDGTKLRGQLASGVDTYELVAFENGGYEGSTVAERRDDNVVIVDGPAPSCAAIGFGDLSSATPPPTAPPAFAQALFSSGFEVGDTAWNGTRGGAGLETAGCQAGAGCARFDTAARTNDQSAFFYHDLGNQPFDSVYVGADFKFPTGFSFQPVADSNGVTQSNDLKALVIEVLPDSAGRAHRLFLNFKARGGDPSHGQLAALASVSENRWAFASQDIVADSLWHRVEFEAQRRPNGEPGRFRAWLDGTNVIDDAYKLCLGECAPVAEFKVGAYVNFASTLAQRWFVDNVVFGRTRESVVLGH